MKDAYHLSSMGTPYILSHPIPFPPEVTDAIHALLDLISLDEYDSTP